MQMREKVGKSRNTLFFQWLVAPEGRKVGSLKQRVQSQLARREMKNCTPLWREAHFQVKMYKTHHSRTTFGNWDVEKCTPLWREAHFQVKMYKTHHGQQLRCRKSARRCGANHISKSKCTKHTSFGPRLEVEMSKKCTRLWREARVQVKMCKTPQCWTTFGNWDVEKVHAVVARSTFPSQNVKNTRGLDNFWTFRCRKSARPCGAKHISKSKCEKKLQVRTTSGGSDVASLRFTRLHLITLHYTTLHSTTLHSTILHSTTLQLQLHNYIPLHYATLHYTKLHYTTLHYITLHSTALQYTTLHYTTPHYLPLDFTTINTWHFPPLHYNYATTLHYASLH